MKIKDPKKFRLTEITDKTTKEIFKVEKVLKNGYIVLKKPAHEAYEKEGEKFVKILGDEKEFQRITQVEWRVNGVKAPVPDDSVMHILIEDEF